ncbi:c-di-GMP-binding flagellar brake protein YcgR [Thiogranum longum]|uniref:C-di-GMP-binding flagellar brake protein YcgR n=1 Tax=Thiogranum longum TaxID=1537524 RepID=A0A4R1HAB8_9GAMM|nr:flagellar brake protein [Thiogranum longum]TCK18877.1 c-di-GMP-binding flagellar brake protein YcgR [Thiogranum longum]
MPATLTHALQGEAHNSGEETVTSRCMIIATLHQLKAEHELLSVRVSGCPDTASSAILGIKEDQDCYYLDELNLPISHKAFLKKRKAVIHCRLQGMEVRIPCKLLKASSDKGIALYKIGLPKRIVRIQRREHFRLRLNAGLVIPVTVPRLEGHCASGEAFDLSAGGVGAFIHTSDVPSRGQILSEVAIALPQAPSFKTSIEIRFARVDEIHHSLRIGGRFVSLDKNQERIIAHFLAEQQRKRRRHNPV